MISQNFKIYKVEEVVKCLFVKAGDQIDNERVNLYLFYIQAWSLAIYGRPLFLEPIIIDFNPYKHLHHFDIEVYNFDIKICDKISSIRSEYYDLNQYSQYTNLMKNDKFLKDIISLVIIVHENYSNSDLKKRISTLKIFNNIKSKKYEKYFMPLKSLREEFREFIDFDSMDEHEYLKFATNVYDVNLDDYDNFYKLKFEIFNVKIKTINNLEKKLKKTKKTTFKMLTFTFLVINLLYIIVKYFV